MKKVLSVLAIAALFVVSFSSCGGNEKTATELLTQKNGWVLSSATSAPAYQMLDGSFAGDLINDGYLYDFEAAYIIAFNENGNEIVKPGKVVAAEDFDGDAYREETSLGNWSFDKTENPEYINTVFINSATRIITHIIPLKLSKPPCSCRSLILQITFREIHLVAVFIDGEQAIDGPFGIIVLLCW